LYVGANLYFYINLFSFDELTSKLNHAFTFFKNNAHSLIKCFASHIPLQNKFLKVSTQYLPLRTVKW